MVLLSVSFHNVCTFCRYLCSFLTDVLPGGTEETLSSSLEDMPHWSFLQPSPRKIEGSLFLSPISNSGNRFPLIGIGPPCPSTEDCEMEEFFSPFAGGSVGDGPGEIPNLSMILVCQNSGRVLIACGLSIFVHVVFSLDVRLEEFLGDAVLRSVKTVCIAHLITFASRGLFSWSITSDDDLVEETTQGSIRAMYLPRTFRLERTNFVVQGPNESRPKLDELRSALEASLGSLGVDVLDFRGDDCVVSVTISLRDVRYALPWAPQASAYFACRRLKLKEL